MARLPDLDRVADLIATVAAEEMMPRFRQLDQAEIKAKGQHGDVVTIVDEICERRLSAALSDLLPGSVVVGEEEAAAEEAVMDRLSGDRPVWLIDPLDGTRNFARGIDEFASMVALVEGDDVLAGWIHDPVAGQTAMAAQGEGAWRGGERLRVAESKPEGERIGAFNIPSSGKRHRAAKALANRIKTRERVRCAGHCYLALASGAWDLAVFRTLKPWDHAPGVLIHREAGGVSGLWPDGETYRPSVGKGPLIIAPDRRTWRETRATLGQDFAHISH